MSTPDSKRARELLFRHRSSQSELDRQALADLKSTRGLVDQALRLAADGKTFMVLKRQPTPGVESLLLKLGFRVLTVAAEQRRLRRARDKEKINRREKLPPLIANARAAIDDIRRDIRGWIYVAVASYYSIQDVDRKIVPLIFDRLNVGEDPKDWKSAIAALDEWCESDLVFVSDLVSAPRASRALQRFVGRMELNSVRFEKLVAGAKVARNALREAELLSAEAAGSNDDGESISAPVNIAKTTLIIAWSAPKACHVNHLGEVNAASLEWLSNEDGQAFLGELDLSIKAMARAGEASLMVEASQVGCGAARPPNMKCIAQVLRALGFKAKVARSGVEVRWD